MITFSLLFTFMIIAILNSQFYNLHFVLLHLAYIFNILFNKTIIVFNAQTRIQKCHPLKLSYYSLSSVVRSKLHPQIHFENFAAQAKSIFVILLLHLWFEQNTARSANPLCSAIFKES